MMMHEVQEAFECDVLGNDSYYINNVGFNDDDYYNIRRMMEQVKYNLSELDKDKLMLACAMMVYVSHKVDDSSLRYLHDDLEDNIKNCLVPVYDECYKEYNQIQLEKELKDEDKECS